MKSFLYSLLLVVSLASCSKNEDPAVATDPFLGHWQSQTLRSVDYDAAGKQTKEETTPVNTQLDVSATTLTFTTVQPNGQTSKEVDQYVRSGESITVTPPSGNIAGETYFIRSLTSSSFTFEFNGRRTAGKSYYIQTVPFRR